MFLVSSCSCLYAIYWEQVVSQGWRCSWSSAGRRCSNYIWLSNNLNAYYGAFYIRGFAVILIAAMIQMIERIMMMNDDDEEEGENDDDDDDDEDGDDDDADLLLFGCLRTKWKNWKLGGFFLQKGAHFFQPQCVRILTGVGISLPVWWSQLPR